MAHYLILQPKADQILLVCEVNLAAQDMQTPRTGTQKAVKRIMAYLSSTADRRLWVPSLTSQTLGQGSLLDSSEELGMV